MARIIERSERIRAEGVIEQATRTFDGLTNDEAQTILLNAVMKNGRVGCSEEDARFVVEAVADYKIDASEATALSNKGFSDAFIGELSGAPLAAMRKQWLTTHRTGSVFRFEYMPQANRGDSVYGQWNPTPAMTQIMDAELAKLTGVAKK